MRDPVTLERGLKLLMDRYQAPLYQHLRHMLTDHDDTHDVLQNCFIKAYRNIGQFEGKSKLYTWLYRIASNEAITFLNNRKRRAVDSIDENNVLGNALKADAPIDGELLQLQLEQAMETLPQKQKLVFTLRYYDELPYEEMSKILHTSVGALKASYHHAVKKIEHFFNNK
jgi:RNA polymerase sigma-70 factor, ECF subfamily